MQPELPWSMYIRTSTVEQGDKSSPLKQFMANVAFAKANGKTIPGIDSALAGNKVLRGDYIFVDAQSGTNDDRPDLQRFLALAKTGKVGGVVCFVVDRAARNLSDALKIHRDLKRMKVGFKFAQQNFDDTPAGILMFQVFAAFAEYECKIIAERTHDGTRKRILGIGKKDSKPRPHGPALYGYHLEDGIAFEDAKEGPIARLYLRMGLEPNNTAGQIANALNEAGHRTREGAKWRGTTISKYLRKALTYAGTYTHRHGIQAAVKAHEEALELMGSDAPALDLSTFEILAVEAYPPLITREEANLILSRVAKNKAKAGQPTRQYALSHYLWCDVCGERWYARQGRYYCGCTQLGKPRCRAISSVAQGRMESAVIDGMKSYLKRPDAHYALAMEDYNASRGPKRAHGEIEKQVRALTKEHAHYDEQATEFKLTPRQREIAKKKSRDLELQIAELNAEVRQSSVVMLPSESGIVAAFAQILDILDRMVTFAEKREFVEATISRIQTDGRQVKVRGAFDVQLLGNQAHKRGTYTIEHLDARLNKSTPIPINFQVPLPAIKHTGGWPRRTA